MSKGPGKAHRKGISLRAIFRKFPDSATAEAWFAERRWPAGVVCPHCDSADVQTGAAHKTMPYRCREKTCRKRFSVKTKTVMEASNLDYQVWAVAIYLMLVNIKGVSSMKLHRDLEITQKSAWHLAHRLRKAWAADDGRSAFMGPSEMDETFIGGKRPNMSNAKRKALKKAGAGRGADGKIAIAGIKDRKTGQIRARVVQNTDGDTLKGFIYENTARKSTVYTDDARAYLGLKRKHRAVKHSVSEYVNGQAHTNGIEGFWSLLKRGYHGTYHKMSPKHLDLYVTEFAARANIRGSDTIRQMENLAAHMVGRRLKYEDLCAGGRAVAE